MGAEDTGVHVDFACRNYLSKFMNDLQNINLKHMNDNSVTLIGYYGSDEIHACSAWTSTSRDITEEKRTRIPNILSMLAAQGHHTPFEKSSLHFLVNSDIASHIHKLKHRIGVSINAESARYKELKEDKFYLPEDWRNIKAANYTEYDGHTVVHNFILHNDSWHDILERYTSLGNKLYHLALKDLEKPLGRKRAKESARFFKTYNSQIDCDIMFNWRSFYHFLSLRNKKGAQKEIREIAAEMLRLVKNIEGNPFEFTIKAFEL
jgi:thymidylate synthase (FAD)